MVFTHKADWWCILAIACLVAAIGGTFAGVIECRYIGLDDGNNIFLNPLVGGLSWERVGLALGDLGAARRYMPLGWLGFSAVFTWQGLTPAGYHLASLGWHGLAAVALFAATRNVLRLAAPAVTPGWKTWVAVIVAAAWALHPMRTEAVAWASGLLYTQASAFAFVALWLWTLRWACPKFAGWFASGSSVALAASLLTYPIALGLPVVCWLLDLAAAKNTPGASQSRPALARHGLGGGLLGLVLVAGLVFAATLFARGENSANFAAPASLGDFGFLDRGLQALYVWGRYLVQLVWPVGLSPVYTELYPDHLLGRSVLPTVLLTVLLLGAAVTLAWRRQISPGPVVAYSIMALPFLGLLEHPWIAHDRYATLLHPVWLIVGGQWLLRVKAVKFRLAVSGVWLGLIILGAVQARSLIGVWPDQWGVHARLRQTLPRNAWAGYYLGKVPASVLFLEGRFAEIGPWLDQAEAEAPGWSAGPVRAEFTALIRQHQEFLRQNWPGRVLAPGAVWHYLHGKSAQAGLDWVTARAHFQAALWTAADFGEARREEAWCELELHRPAAAAAAMAQAAVLLPASSPGAREQEFWASLAAVYRARGETQRAAEITARTPPHHAVPGGN